MFLCVCAFYWPKKVILCRTGTISHSVSAVLEKRGSWTDLTKGSAYTHRDPEILF